MDLNELTIEELLVIQKSLTHPNYKCRAVRKKIMGAIDDKRATQHMIETGSYPSWYQDRTRS